MAHDELKLSEQILETPANSPLTQNTRDEWGGQAAQLEAQLDDAHRIISIELVERKKLEAENERLREAMNEIGVDDWFAQNEPEFMAKWYALLEGKEQ